MPGKTCGDLGRLWKESLCGTSASLGKQRMPAPGVCSQIKSSEDVLAGHHHASLIKHALDSVEQINQYFLAAFPTGSFPEAQCKIRNL